MIAMTRARPVVGAASPRGWVPAGRGRPSPAADRRVASPFSYISAILNGIGPAAPALGAARLRPEALPPEARAPPRPGVADVKLC